MQEAGRSAYLNSKVEFLTERIKLLLIQNCSLTRQFKHASVFWLTSDQNCHNAKRVSVSLFDDQQNCDNAR
jgi:hypothetical protein